MWTRFIDMHSGGRPKTKYEEIYIEAPRERAIEIFMDRFGRHPDWISCSCCGEDFVVREMESLEKSLPSNLDKVKIIKAIEL